MVKNHINLTHFIVIFVISYIQRCKDKKNRGPTAIKEGKKIILTCDNPRYPRQIGEERSKSVTTFRKNQFREIIHMPFTRKNGRENVYIMNPRSILSNFWGSLHFDTPSLHNQQSFTEGWTTRIRTGNDRTKTCSVTITPSSSILSQKQWLRQKIGCKGSVFLRHYQIFSPLFLSAREIKRRKLLKKAEVNAQMMGRLIPQIF